MNPTISAIRSIGSEFAQRLYTPIAVITAVVGLVLLSGSIFLTTISSWWWILVTLLIIAAVIVTIILVAVGLLIRTLRPAQTKEQAVKVRTFVDKIQNLADLTGTPKAVILFRIVKDMTTKGKTGYLQGLYGDTVSMRSEFRDITQSF